MSNPIHIRLLRTLYPHWGEYSGISQFQKYLDSNRFRMNVYGVPDSDAEFPLPFKSVRRFVRNRIQRSGMSWYKLSDLLAEIRAIPGCFVNRTDIVHFLDGEHTAQYLPGWLRRMEVSRTKTVATYHQPPELLDGLIRRDVVSRLDRVMVLSPEQADYFMGFLPKDRVEFVLHGIDTRHFRPSEKHEPRRIFRCITTGHWLRDWDAIRAVAQELSSNSDIEFHLVTNRETGMEGFRNVTIYHDIEDSRLLDLYQGADVLFLPLKSATATNSLLEGIACGLPVVSTRLASVKAYVPGMEAILIPANHPADLSEAILRLSRDPEECKNMGRRARRRAEALDWRIIAQEYQRVYAGMISPDYSDRP